MKAYFKIILMALVALPLYASEGDKVGGGGNPVLIRKSQIIQELRNMPTNMRMIAKVTGYKTQLQSPAKEIFEDMMKRDFLSDLVSPYRIVDSKLGTGECVLDGQRVSAMSKMGDLRGEICFDVDLILSLNTTRAELIGLAFHEYAHHFNYLDKDHFLAASIAEAYVDMLPNASGITRYGNYVVCIDPERHPLVEIFGKPTSNKYTSHWCLDQPLTLRANAQKAYQITCPYYQPGVAYLKSANGESIELVSGKSFGLAVQWILFSNNCASDLAQGGF